MFRIAIIIAALLSGHHQTHVTRANGGGYMTTSLPCVGGEFSQIAQRTPRILCINGHRVVKMRLLQATAELNNGAQLATRRAAVYNAEGRLAGWVDWTPGAGLIGHVLVRNGLNETWQEGR